MKFGLGLSLAATRRRGDLPSLDLAFALDKTLTARRGPTPVFTRASAATCIGSDGLIQSAAINAPRFDHHPLTGVCRGLLIEEQRTNSVLNSENFSGAGWLGFGASIQSVAVTNPAGGATSQKLVESATNVEHGIYRIASNTGTVTLSVYVKEAGRRYCYLRRDGNTNAVFDLVSGNITQVSGGVTANMTAAVNGWWRISLTTTEVGNWVLKLANAGTGILNNLAYAGDGSSGVLMWGAQLEAGSFPTSYIPTTSAPVPRSADVCSMTAGDFTGFYNQSEGTFFVEYDRSIISVSGKFNWMVAAAYNPLSPSTYNVIVATPASDARTIYRNAGVDVYGASMSLGVANVPVKLSYAYKSENFSSAKSGAIASTGNGVVPALSVFDRMDLGFSNNGSFGASSGQYLNGHIARLTYYKKRLPDAKLQAITS